MTITARHCYCEDPGCPIITHSYKDNHRCAARGEAVTLYRVDMDDQDGTPMCPECAADAMESGLFLTYDDDPNWNHSYTDILR